MKILVPIKRVADPDNANKVKISDDGTAVTSEGLEWKLNPFDEWSLEAALRLTENAAEKKRVGEVILVTIGPKDAVSTMRQGLAMGAERGILVESNDQELDSHVVAQILAKIVEKEEPDVVFLGKQSADGDSNVAGTKLAEFLASGVRPIQYGCNSEVGYWVERTGSGIRLPNLDESSLKAAAQSITETQEDHATLIRARDTALAHFGLDAAIANYAGIIREISEEF